MITDINTVWPIPAGVTVPGRYHGATTSLGRKFIMGAQDAVGGYRKDADIRKRWGYYAWLAYCEGYAAGKAVRHG